ncbi:hypothetical protein FOCC_FOCC011741 [Frankliniella occidentalis]|uniref:Zinc finger protein 287 n=1 Tax=Frankliniella occidentalis TaxID=133901 RepID=A0A6J1RXQ5_FRAOC|nr:zinc finger protein 287 [Frankliniella occidentalis]KAE8742709.1 hypothetical protein FOCC_FOCC011741 [Frankliniella occidentalis]
MNYTPFSGHFTQVPAGTVQHYTTAKFAQNVAGPTGQVLGVISSMSEDGVTYVRPVDTNGLTVNLAQSQAVTTQQNQVQPTFISIPVQVPGSKPGDPPQQQMLQIQVVAPSSQALTGAITCDNNQPKYLSTPIITTSAPGNPTVVQFAYNNQSGETVEIPLMQAIQQQQTQQSQPTATENGECNTNNNNNNQQHTIQIQTQTDENDADKVNANKVTVVKVEKDKRFEGQTVQQYVEMPSNWQSLVQPGSTVADCLAKLPAAIPHGLTSFLKFAPTIKRETEIESSPLSTHSPEAMSNDLVVSSEDPLAQDHSSDMTIATDNVGQGMGDGVKKPSKVKKKYKKKNPKPKKTRPGQVTIATALDGTTLFCCPECNMAYSEKELLEQHLAVHKTERRFICDTCGAALKRKEHLERHKLGHNPERPYTCDVCFKGFKRKEHLNLHVVIHSGEKTQVCNECGKGFYRKDHLRKHARSHLTKKFKEELGLVTGNPGDTQLQQGQTLEDGSPIMSILPNTDDVNEDGSIEDHQHHMESTVVLPTQAETSTIMLQHHHH